LVPSAGNLKPGEQTPFVGKVMLYPPPNAFIISTKYVVIQSRLSLLTQKSQALATQNAVNISGLVNLPEDMGAKNNPTTSKCARKKQHFVIKFAVSKHYFEMQFTQQKTSASEV